MKVYAVKHEGHYPVGAGSVVVARDKGHVKRLLDKTPGLAHPLNHEHTEIVEVPTDAAGVCVINNGDY